MFYVFCVSKKIKKILCLKWAGRIAPLYFFCEITLKGDRKKTHNNRYTSNRFNIANTVELIKNTVFGLYWIGGAGQSESEQL